jgi:hypothetical protein
MSSLVDLAIEPLTEVISLLNTRQWTALWLTGDFRIQWKMPKGKAAREMSVRWPHRSSCLLPPLLDQLSGLQSFCFYREYEYRSGHLTSADLSRLSRNLTSLVVTSAFAFEAFEALAVSNPGHFVQLEKLHINCISKIERIGFEIPSTVTDLKLFFSRPDVGPHPFILSGCPSTWPNAIDVPS